MFRSIRFRKGILHRLGEKLVNDGLIGEDQLRVALEKQRTAGGFLGETLLSLGYLTPRQIGPYLEELTGYPFIDLGEVEVASGTAQMLDEKACRERLALPFREEGGRIAVAMADPMNLAAVDDIRSLLDRPIVPHLAMRTDLDDAIRRIFDVRQKTRDLVQSLEPTATAPQAVAAESDDLDEAPLVRLVHGIVSGALAAGASDIHIEPQEENVRVRYRVDGVLYDQMTMPLHSAAAVSSRLKVMSRLDIAERRRPQDGRFATRDEEGRNYDVRLSIMPTIYGEKACMRLLEKSNSHATLELVGFLPDQRTSFDRMLKRPHGIILVTGPTGSGKSTTLFAALQALNHPSININTIEDPVEYKLPGANQIQVNPKIGVTFASGLRTLLRQDPDVILVGEIRDRETAEIAIQAALTGHLVLSTLHTNDAPSAITRLQHMGVEPFLISSALLGVVGQRLLRKVCPHCRETYLATDEHAEMIGLGAEEGRLPIVARGAGCRRCGGRGMRGRTATFEVMPMTDRLREASLRTTSSSDLREVALQEGMVGMRSAAMKKVLELEVAPEEAIRVLSSEEEL
jgi:type IV pilus assembly protein PilB